MFLCLHTALIIVAKWSSIEIFSSTIIKILFDIIAYPVGKILAAR